MERSGHPCTAETDFGPEPHVTNIARAAMENQVFRRALWTGCHLQITVMCIPPGGEIGLEVHPDTDQFLHIVQGNGLVKMGARENRVDLCKVVRCGDGVFVPAGAWHDLLNTGRGPLKLYTIYAPPHHPSGTIHPTKAEAEAEHG